MKDDFKITELEDGRLEITAEDEWFDNLMNVTNTDTIEKAINKILKEYVIPYARENFQNIK